MAQNELITMLVGAGAGYLIGSSGKATGTEPPQSCRECISTPLYERTVADQTPSYGDFTSLETFPKSKSGIEHHDFWHGCIVKDLAGNVYQTASFHMYGLYNRVWFTNLTTGEFVENKITDQSQILWEYIDTYIKITSPFGTVIIDTVNNSASVNYTVQGHTISLTYSGKPMFYNDKNTVVLVPETYYLSGFELVGKARGTIDGVAVDGFGDFERCNWNWTTHLIPNEKWIGFTLGEGNTCGVIYQQGLFQDCGIYITGIYKKPLAFNINAITSYYNGSKIFPLNQEVHVRFPDGIFILKMTWLGKSGDENIYDVSATFRNTELGTGMAWVEMSDVI